MRHVDEGTLHAYLDGALEAVAAAGELPDGASAADVVAHLDMCADCRARLDVERAIRERAGIVLRDSAPQQVDVPPLPAQSKRRAAMARSVPFAWAASLLLAVGAGWWGSAIWRDQTGMPAASSQVTEGAASSSDPALDTERAPAAPPAAADGDTRATEPPPQAAAQAESGRPADAAQAESGRRAETSDVAPSEVARSEVARSEVARSEVEEVRGEVLAPASRAAANPQALESRMAAAPLPPEPQPQRFQPLAAVTGVVAAPAVPVDTTQSLPGQFRSFMERESRQRVQWVLKSPGEVPGSATIHAIAGATEPVVEMALEIGADAIRVRQILPEGKPVEVVSWRPVPVALDAIVVAGNTQNRAASDARERRAEQVEALPPPPPPASAAPAKAAAALSIARDAVLPDGRRELIVHHHASDTWIAVRARLSSEALRALELERRPPAR